ncbi:ankyrin repeat domain-containing protein [Fluoribacter dumoffii]|uniref:Dot/Icm T4SS effector AnkG/AnkZ/LegA7 n=1 Tax=Fluoribacter dumoffii TaxID=463 RepID=UPI002243E3C5|nr:Dot/Icm T4SS effector AnkG/AnkZ/LegA7 [Fluoribacter dumoffii]MCW8387647.1 ankyrin repeat domain-containing protein [Fluoribacter dumoffii]MCW8416808.1 ankyrin repeat domain-containing protein [Fluoribacter dumoffii]MCW8455352.1 ankyrin repeat domain-containing protein [Fluoribacter dumoffii]MCW8460570.1 ankyrin repeat domain-containing protein [Fluoribacter dumoffii]MCW8484051.1 ankyrin repeat domain-containing protein [Fluoribacter dumoffii]
MIYVLYLLLSISLLITLYQLKPHIFNPLASLLFFTPRRNALEHEDLLTLFDKFNYEHGDGVCHGFTLTWALETAHGLDEQFYSRLNLIKNKKERLPHTLTAISEKIKSSQTLSTKEYKLNEIKPFLESICLAQSPDDYSEIYAQMVQQSNIDLIYKMIQLNLCRKQNSVKNLFNKTIGLLSPRHVNEFLHQLNNLLATKNKVAVVCSSEEHTVGFKKHKSNTWLFIDINHLYEQSREYPYQLLTSEELVPILYQSLFESSKQLLFHCAFIAKTGQRKLTQYLQELDKLYPVHAKNLPISNCRGYGLLALAVQNDDRNTVREILRLHKKASVISLLELEHALFYAAACNRAHIMKQLLKLPQISPNMSCDKKGNTPLAIACKYGNEATVHILLREGGIEVNAKNIKAETPLMLACKSFYTQKCPSLFERLLAAGANTNLSNIDEKTAYEIALAHNNQTALNVLQLYQPPKLQNLAAAADRCHPEIKSTSASTPSFLSYSFLKRGKQSIIRLAQEDDCKQAESQKLAEAQTELRYF